MNINGDIHFEQAAIMKIVNSVSQVQELHKKMTEETRRADNLAYEMKKLEEKHETVLKEKEVWEHLRH